MPQAEQKSPDRHPPASGGAPRRPARYVLAVILLCGVGWITSRASVAPAGTGYLAAEPARSPEVTASPAPAPTGHHRRRPAKTTRHPGAIFDYQVGENILRLSYHQLLHRFGPPWKTVTRRRGERCAYYKVVGHARGWLFCFRGAKMISAAGSRRPGAGS